ncbi:hypothetical protein JT359_20075 [Candidatus Poribacteria bacterium]|nr:hypothetical protein [Candidatus Poribacteria bacterium]
MKETRFLYCIAILAITGIFVAFISDAIDTPAVSKVNQPPVKAVAPVRATTSTAYVAPVKTTTTSTKTEITDYSCGCCTERKALARKRIQHARERRLFTQSVSTDNATHK